jgi:hypothetical protein
VNPARHERTLAVVTTRGGVATGAERRNEVVWWRGEQEGSQGNAPGKISGGMAHREALALVGQRRSFEAAAFLPTMMLWSADSRCWGSLQYQDDDGEVRGGPVEGEGRRERRLPEEWTCGDGGFKNGGTGDSSAGGGGRVVEGHREEGGRSLCALLARRGGMGKERTAAVIGALQRGMTDSFVAKKWKGKGRGGSDAARRHVAGGEGGQPAGACQWWRRAAVRTRDTGEAARWGPGTVPGGVTRV